MEIKAPAVISGAKSRLTTSFNARNTLTPANHETCSTKKLCRILEQVTPNDASSSPPTKLPQNRQIIALDFVSTNLHYPIYFHSN